jgi:hypothetical protein
MMTYGLKLYGGCQRVMLVEGIRGDRHDGTHLLLATWLAAKEGMDQTEQYLILL